MKRVDNVRAISQWVFFLMLLTFQSCSDKVKDELDPGDSPTYNESIKIKGFSASVVLNSDKIYMVRRQKIVVMTEGDLQNSRRKSIPILFNGKTIDARIIRVSEYENPTEEYNGVTYTVLLEFEEKFTGSNLFSLRTLSGVRAQANNFVLNPIPPKSSPPPPTDSNSDKIIKILNSDFRIVRVEDINQYSSQAKVVIAIVDTGIKFNFIDHPAYSPYQYTDNSNQLRAHNLVRGYKNDNSRANAIGYCGVTEYLRASAESDPQYDEMYRNNPELSIFRGYERQEILNSAFDDERGLNTQNQIVGRHGTFITSIINQKTTDASVLPVKAFNYSGHGTLYDMLCCLNYVLAQKKNGVPVQVLNASWSAKLNEEGLSLLKSKFKQLERAGILVVASAGNTGQDLSKYKVYPACFSNELNNVITVTSLKSKLDNRLGQASSGYEVSLNYSKEFVSVGVYGGQGTDDGMLSPFLVKSDSKIYGTSFAAAHVSALIAEYLAKHSVILNSTNIGGTKERILNALTKVDQGLASEVAGGRYLQVK